ncbi:MAG: L-threonylcarbamoyladenylate synthase [Pseudomonadota bacterium]
MADIVRIHPENPQPRRVDGVAAALRRGALVAYPTDSTFAFGCSLGNAEAIERIRKIRKTDKNHNFTLVCKDLSEIATYARVDNWAYRLLRTYTPGPYTFILRATGEVPKRMQHPKRRTIGIRVPDHAVVQALLDSLGEPIVSSTLMTPDWEFPPTDPYEIDAVIGSRLDVVVDGGPVSVDPTSVIDLSAGEVDVLREGRGDISSLA